MNSTRSSTIYSAIPSDWKIVPLSNLLRRVRKPVEVEADKLYREIGILSHGKGIFHKEERTGASLGNKSVFWVEPDCFVVNIVFAWEQAIAKTTNAEKGMIASHRFPMYKPKAGTLDLDFLISFFNTPQGKYLLGLASPGGAGRNKTLGQQAFLDLSIPLPAFPEQCKITDILNTVDQAIALTEWRIEAARQRKKGLMQRLLTGRVRFPEFEGEEWQEFKLGDACESIVSGGTPSTQIEEYWSGTIPWITGADFSEMRVSQVRRYITEEAVANSSTTIINQGDLLLVSRTGVGKIAIAPFDVAISQDITGITPKERLVDTSFLLNILAWTLPQLARYNQGTSINGVTRRDLVRHRVPLPSLLEQRRIAVVFQACDREIELLTKKRNALQRQKKGLTQRLLTGQVRVKV
jgi:type I restriction enzyme S subunit